MQFFFTDTLSGYIGTENGLVSTKDGGKTWTREDIIGQVNDVVFINDSTGWCVGHCGICYTENAGTSWKSINSGVNTLKSGIVFVDSGKTGFIFAYENTLLKLERGVTSVENKTLNKPSSINLYQNYPNPFNPTTVIEFDLQETSKVQLKVYDITGKEVNKLFRGTKNSGSYKVRWDGTDNRGNEVSSGIYFYQLEVNYFIKTKKMILIR